MNSNFLRTLLLLSTAFLLTNCSFFQASKHNVKEDGFVYIPSQADFQEVLDSLSNKLIDSKSFSSYATSKEYPQNIKPGKYKLIKGETNKDLVQRLMTGAQEQVPLMIRNEPTIYHLAGSVSKKIEADSAQIVESILNWAKQKDTDLTEETVKIYFIPNTYNFYWTTTADKFVERMETEFNKVWTEERQQKAKDMNFSLLEVFTLASIVQMESSKIDEQPKVAQVYLNRLKKNMKLQADPTSIYAYRLQNGFGHKIQRVRKDQLIIPSAYNTYRVTGLPPAPICLPNLSAVDAVLNPEEHTYIYFCADPDRPGYHSFTSNYAEHQKNAKKYRIWLESRGIKK